jgi:hypothetical protein
MHANPSSLDTRELIPAGVPGEAAALGGLPTVENLRQRCTVHNRLHAEATFGRELVARYRRQASRTGESALAGESAP